MIFKHGVRIATPHPLLLIVMKAVDEAYNEVVGHEAMMTSANDSQHMDGSLHYEGKAWDFRNYKDNLTSNPRYDATTIGQIVARIRAKLGPSFQILTERTHIHIEFDPA